MWHRSNYDWMLFLTSPIAFIGVSTHELVFTNPLNHCCSLSLHTMFTCYVSIILVHSIHYCIHVYHHILSLYPLQSDTSSQVSHVNEKPALAGPFYPSTLSLDSRKSQREAEAQLQPSQSVSENELKEQLHAIDEPKGINTFFYLSNLYIGLES